MDFQGLVFYVSGSIAVVGFCSALDFVVLPSEQIRTRMQLNAVLDNCAHGAVAFLSWTSMCGVRCRQDLLNAMLCGLMACAIDLDHFVSAKSLQIKEAIRLHHRPFFHTTTWAVALFVLWCLRRDSFYLPLLLVAIVSHHLRDAVRRGLWFWPVGSTPPLPWWMGCALIVLLPLAGQLLGMVSRTELSRSTLTVIV